MRGLADLRVLILLGPTVNTSTGAILDALNRQTTSHLLRVTPRTLPVMLLRLVKRLALGQDDVIILYDTPLPAQLLLALTARLGKRPVLVVLSRPAIGLAQLLTKAAGISPVPAAAPAILLRALARRTRRAWPAAGQAALRLDVGCGSQARPGFVGIDARRTPATAIVADARALAVQSQVADEVYASCLLEHFDNPHEVLREIHRVLHAEGQAVLRLPNLGTYSSHLDTTHRFLADLALWRRILAGYFAEVRVVPVGTKYRDNPWLVRVNWVLVHIFRWYELAQGWDFICRHPKAIPSVEYTGWWEE